MSYTAKSFNQTWGFQPDGGDFNAKTGNTLKKGVFGR